MGGVDASAGFAYQHAQAVHMALTLAADPSLHAIRVEAANDIIDVEIRVTPGVNKSSSTSSFAGRGWRMIIPGRPMNSSLTGASAPRA